jgi:hypothetical protein
VIQTPLISDLLAVLDGIAKENPGMSKIKMRVIEAKLINHLFLRCFAREKVAAQKPENIAETLDLQILLMIDRTIIL